MFPILPRKRNIETTSIIFQNNYLNTIDSSASWTQENWTFVLVNAIQTKREAQHFAQIWFPTSKLRHYELKWIRIMTTEFKRACQCSCRSFVLLALIIKISVTDLFFNLTLHRMSSKLLTATGDLIFYWLRFFEIIYLSFDKHFSTGYY